MFERSTRKQAIKRRFQGLAGSPLAQINEELAAATTPEPAEEEPSKTEPKKRGRPRTGKAKTPAERKRAQRERKKNQAAIEEVLRTKEASWGAESIPAKTGGYGTGNDDDPLVLADAREQEREEFGGVRTAPKSGSDDSQGGGGFGRYNFEKQAKQFYKEQREKQLEDFAAAMSDFWFRTEAVYTCRFCAEVIYNQEGSRGAHMMSKHRDMVEYYAHDSAEPINVTADSIAEEIPTESTEETHVLAQQ